MTLDRSALVAELANVRAQQQNFMRLVEQAGGAEKALLGLIGLIDKMEAENAVEVPPLPHPDAVAAAAVERRTATRALPLAEQDEEPEPTAYDMGTVRARAARRDVVTARNGAAS